MNWITLNNAAQLSSIREASYEKPRLIFKHSTRCGISSMALNRLKRGEESVDMDLFFLDLVKYRDISNSIAVEYAVRHESPQLLLIYKGECVYEASHSDIRIDDLLQAISLSVPA